MREPVFLLAFAMLATTAVLVARAIAGAIAGRGTSRSELAQIKERLEQYDAEPRDRSWPRLRSDWNSTPPRWKTPRPAWPISRLSSQSYRNGSTSPNGSWPKLEIGQRWDRGRSADDGPSGNV